MSKGRSPVNYELNDKQRELVIKNLNLVRTVIRDRFSVYHEYYDDMMQEGTIGLIKAVARHDDSRGAQLSTFAYFCIKNEIQKFVSECTDAIKVPVSVRLAMNVVNEISKNGGSQEDIDEVLNHNQISKDMLNSGMRASVILSLNAETDEGTPFLELVAGEDNVDTNVEEDERRMYCELHDWLNYNYPDKLLDNRIYMDYLWLSNNEKSITVIYDHVRNIYNVNRNETRKIITKYKDVVSNYLKNKK